MIIAAWGPEKSGKSTIGLTMPQPIWCANFDLGIDESQLGRFPGIKYEDTKYPLPIELRLGVGLITKVKALWEQFIADFVDVLEGRKLYKGEQYATILIDTSTQMQRTVRRALLQMKQEVQMERWTNGSRKSGEELRSSLLQIEYGEPNSKMQAVIYAPKQYGKHMFLSHYETEEYKDSLIHGEKVSMATGKMIMEGFKDTTGLSDIVMRTYREKGEF